MKRASSDAHAPLDFIESMECLAVTKLPDGPEWTYEIKLDGFRLEAVKTDGKVTLYSRRGKMLNQKFPYIAAALSGIPEGTIIDGELVALDEEGRSVFNLLQNYRSAESQIHFYAFDLLVHKGKDLTSLPLSERRKLLEKMLHTDGHIGLSVVSNKSDEMLAFVREHGLEGVVAKRRDSFYQPGKRSAYGQSTASIWGRNSWSGGTRLAATASMQSSSGSTVATTSSMPDEFVPVSFPRHDVRCSLRSKT